MASSKEEQERHLAEKSIGELRQNIDLLGQRLVAFQEFLGNTTPSIVSLKRYEELQKAIVETRRNISPLMEAKGGALLKQKQSIEKLAGGPFNELAIGYHRLIQQQQELLQREKPFCLPISTQLVEQTQAYTKRTTNIIEGLLAQLNQDARFLLTGDFQLSYNSIYQEKEYLTNNIRVLQSILTSARILAGLDVQQTQQQLKQCLQGLTEQDRPLERLKQQIKQSNQQILVARSYVPQQYAGIGTYHPGLNQYLVATHGIGPCVGVSLYIPGKQVGMVAHFDSSHFCLRRIETSVEIQEEQLRRYFDNLVREMHPEAGQEIIGTIIVSTTDHEGLDVAINGVLGRLKEQLIKTGIILRVYKIQINKDVACLICDLQTGRIYTNYKEVGLVGGSIIEALNLPPDFQLYHLREGNIYLQPIDRPYQVVTRINTTPFSIPVDGMIPQDAEAVRLIQQHRTRSTDVGASSSRPLLFSDEPGGDLSSSVMTVSPSVTNTLVSSPPLPPQNVLPDPP